MNLNKLLQKHTKTDQTHRNCKIRFEELTITLNFEVMLKEFANNLCPDFCQIEIKQSIA